MPSILAKISVALLPPNDLWRAAKLGDVSAIRRLVASGSNVNEKNRNLNVEGDTPLHFAARHNQVEAVKVLLELGARPDSKNDSHATPLIDAVFYECSDDVVEALLKGGACLNAQDDVGHTALDMAASRGSKRLVGLLLQKGANPNQEKGTKKSEALTKAIENNSREVFEMLLTAGAKPGSSHDISPAIQTAAIYGRDFYVAQLLKAGADPNTTDRDGMPTIICAVRGKSLQVLRRLIEAGALVNSRNSQGETALDIAREIRRKDMINLLSGAGAKSGRDLPPIAEKEESGTFWQLQDDSVFTVSIDPWPVRLGKAILSAEMASSDSVQDSIWKIEYRIVSLDDNTADWCPLFPADGHDDEGTVRFEGDIGFHSPGKYGVHFRIAGVGGTDVVELTDWDVTVVA